MKKDFIPEADVLFNTWQANLLSKLSAGAMAWNIPSTVIALLLTKQARWATAFAVAQDPATRTKGAVKEKQEARKDYESELRKQLKAYVTYNPLISDRQREDMALPIHKTTYTRAPVASDSPWLKARTDLLRHVTFDYGGSETSKAKPDGQHGMEMVWEITSEKPSHVRNLTHSVFATRSPLTLEFDEEERGRTLWYAARWENTRGEKGPWSEILRIVIP
jgi:hypothetical protein